MSNKIVLIEDGKTFTPFYFYNDFMKRFAVEFQKFESDEQIVFALSDDTNPYMGKYRIDPISIPLLLSLSQQVVNYKRGKSIRLELSSAPALNKAMEFLYRSNFFDLVGDNMNPCFPIGQHIFNYEKGFIGGFRDNQIRPEHKVRFYSKKDNGVQDIIEYCNSDDEKRNLLIDHYSYEVFRHFGPILENIDDENTNEYIEILSELITNGVVHSESDVFALMYADRFSTKFSISDNGIGFEKSLNKKNDKKEILKEFKNKIHKENNLSKTVYAESFVAILEALFYSMIKDRLGLFDLMINVVDKLHGYFRLHNDYCQIIISNRMESVIQDLKKCREEFRGNNINKDYGKIGHDVYEERNKTIVQNSMQNILKLSKSILDNYSPDARYSAIRTYNVKFRGVHIEVDLPK